MSLYFRGNLYENTLRNRIIANVYTFLFRAHQEFDHYLHKYVYLIVCLLLGLCVFAFCSCSSGRAQSFKSSDIYVSDTMLYKDHSYIIVRERFSTQFVCLHSPDCFCRFNRKFIVVKHE